MVEGPGNFSSSSHLGYAALLVGTVGRRLRDTQRGTQRGEAHDYIISGRLPFLCIKSSLLRCHRPTNTPRPPYLASSCVFTFPHFAAANHFLTLSDSYPPTPPQLGFLGYSFKFFLRDTTTQPWLAQNTASLPTPRLSFGSMPLVYGGSHSELSGPSASPAVSASCTPTARCLS